MISRQYKSNTDKACETERLMGNLFSAEMFNRAFKQKRRATIFFKLRRTTFWAVFICPAITCSVLSFGACAPRESSLNSETQIGATATSKTSSQNLNAPAPDAAPPIVSAHGTALPAMNNGNATNASASKPDVDTAALDAKIAKAERKAKAQKASEADKQRAAAAYLERGNIFYNAQQPSLYKFALRDLRRALRYEPDNTEAREKVDTIVSIYQSMNRPVPELGNEP